MREIKEMVEKVTRTVMKALDMFTPKIKTRTIPYSEIEEEMKMMMEGANKLKNLNNNYVKCKNYYFTYYWKFY